MRLPNLRHLQTFRVLMHSQTVTAAAQQLNVTQPAVSKTIAALEANLGAKLFRRLRGRLYPTRDAARYLSDVEHLFTQLEALAAGIEGVKSSQERQVTISAIPALASSLVGIALAHFAKQYPAVRTRLFADGHLQMISQVSLLQADLGFMYGVPGFGQALNTELIAEFEVVCVLEKTNPLAGESVLTPKLLRASPLVMWEQQSPTGRLVRDAFLKEGIVPEGRIETNSSTAARLLAATGAGVAIIDPVVVAAHPNTNIVMRSFRPRIPLQLFCVQSLSRPLSPLSQEFLKHLRNVANAIGKTLPS